MDMLAFSHSSRPASIRFDCRLDGFGTAELWEHAHWPTVVVDDTVAPSALRATNRSLWELGNAFIAAAREVHWNHGSWVAAGGPTALSTNRHWMFVTLNVDALFEAYGRALDKLVLRAMHEVEVCASSVSLRSRALPALRAFCCNRAPPRHAKSCILGPSRDIPFIDRDTHLSIATGGEPNERGAAGA